MKSNCDDNNSLPIYLDYDLIALSNTMAHSFDEGLSLASTMLNAPLFIVNFYDYIIEHANTFNINNDTWNQIAETSICSAEIIEQNDNFYSLKIPHIGKLIYYSANPPSIRQQQLAEYIAWMISQFGEKRFIISDSNNSPKSSFLFYLINNRLDMINMNSNAFLMSLPQNMQLLACFCKHANTDHYIQQIAQICNYTEFIAVYKQKYRIFLFSQLTPEQMEKLSTLLRNSNIYAGLSYPFSNYKDCSKYASQAIAALNEATKHSWENHLVKYETILILDVLYQYSSDISLAAYRHPLFVQLEEHDKNNHSELYLTATAYLENHGDTHKTARKLSMHRNTVLYRLKQIIEITGYNIQDSSHHASLLYAIALEQALEIQKNYH